MNHASLTGDNLKDAGRVNQEFCKSVPKEAIPDFRTECKQLKDKDLPQED